MNPQIIFIIFFSGWLVFWFVKNNRPKEPDPPPKEYKVNICPGALKSLIDASKELEEINSIQWKLDVSKGNPWKQQVSIDYENGKHIVDFSDTRNRDELQSLVNNQREDLTSRIINALSRVTVVEKTEKKQQQGRGVQ